MTNNERQFKLSEGEAVAEFLTKRLTPYVHRIAVAGSIRRRRPTVHDIDLVAIPQVDVEQVGLPGFGPCQDVDRLVEYLQTENTAGGWCRDLSGGSKIQRFVCHWGGIEIPVDVYLATTQTWPTLLLIRTGSKEHNIKMCRQAQALGVQLKADGSGLLDVGGCKFLKVESEQDIFRQLGVLWREPEERG